MRAISARRPVVGVTTIAGLVSLVVMLIAPVAAAGNESSLPHCVSQIVRVVADGEMIPGPEVCFPTLDEAIAYGDANFTGPTLPAAKNGKKARRGTQASDPGDATQGYQRLGTHYDWSGGNSGGGSKSYYGYCSGGYVNLPSDWDNRISSTWNGCHRVKHHNSSNMGGNYCSTWTAGRTSNVCSSLNNRAESVSYHS